MTSHPNMLLPFASFCTLSEDPEGNKLRSLQIHPPLGTPRTRPHFSPSHFGAVAAPSPPSEKPARHSPRTQERSACLQGESSRGEPARSVRLPGPRCFLFAVKLIILVIATSVRSDFGRIRNLRHMLHTTRVSTDDLLVGIMCDECHPWNRCLGNEARFCVLAGGHLSLKYQPRPHAETRRNCCHTVLCYSNSNCSLSSRIFEDLTTIKLLVLSAHSNPSDLYSATAAALPADPATISRTSFSLPNETAARINWVPTRWSRNVRSTKTKLTKRIARPWGKNRGQRSSEEGK